MHLISSPKVAIIILNWNGRDNTLACLDSVFKIDYPNFDVVVVDNGSTDDSVPTIRKAFLQPHLIETGKNLGYAGGNNVGIRYALEAGADYVLIINNDTTVAPDVLTHLLQAAKKHPEAAVLGPVIYEMERPEVIWTAGEVFGEGFTCLHLRQGESETVLNKDDRHAVDWVTGAAFFTRSSALRDTGLFDERYFLVYEESDWCFRARRAGYSCLIVPQASVWHKVGSAFGSESSPLRIYFSTRNRLLFAEQNLPRKVWLKLIARALKRLIPSLLSPKHSPEPLFKRLYWALRDSLLLWQDPRQKAVRAGIRDYFLRRFGNCPEEIRNLSNQWSKQQ